MKAFKKNISKNQSIEYTKQKLSLSFKQQKCILSLESFYKKIDIRYVNVHLMNN